MGFSIFTNPKSPSLQTGFPGHAGPSIANSRRIGIFGFRYIVGRTIRRPSDSADAVLVAATVSIFSDE